MSESGVFAFDCKACGDPAEIGNIGFVETITGLEREELKYCSDHLTGQLEGVILDIGIGHTGSEAFRAQRAQRKRDRDRGDEVEAAKRREAVTLVDTFYDDRDRPNEAGVYGESVVIAMPKLAKEDLKELGWTATHRRWDDERRVWLADADRVEMIREHMAAKGWSVEVLV